jgi:hypothetical protein
MSICYYKPSTSQTKSPNSNLGGLQADGKLNKCHLISGQMLPKLWNSWGVISTLIPVFNYPICSVLPVINSL